MCVPYWKYLSHFNVLCHFRDKRRGLKSQEVEGEREIINNYISNVTLSPPEWFPQWDGQRCEPFECFINCVGKSQGKVRKETVSINHHFGKRKVSRSGESNLGPSAYQLSQLQKGKGHSLIYIYPTLRVHSFIYCMKFGAASSSWSIAKNVLLVHNITLSWQKAMCEKRAVPFFIHWFNYFLLTTFTTLLGTKCCMQITHTKNHCHKCLHISSVFLHFSS